MSRAHNIANLPDAPGGPGWKRRAEAAARDQLAQGVVDAARRCAESSENDKGPCRCCGDKEAT